METFRFFLVVEDCHGSLECHLYIVCHGPLAFFYLCECSDLSSVVQVGASATLHQQRCMMSTAICNAVSAALQRDIPPRVAYKKKDKKRRDGRRSKSGCCCPE